MDFVLWKPSGDDLPGWDSPWGRGRPGWHIECSAMAHELLGESFDIHAGGIDLQFPHHENEIAQSACAHPQGEFARVWLHNEMLQVEGKKMSKSLGNFFTVRDLLDQGVPGEVIRFVLLSTHYRKPMDWTKEKATEAKEALLGFMAITRGVEPVDPDPEIVAALSDDLNTAAAISRLHALRKAEQGDVLLASARLMGLLDFSPSVGTTGWGPRAEAHHNLANEIARKWAILRNERNYAAADVLKSLADAAGVELQATKQSVGQGAIAKLGPNFDPAKLEALK
jgi:cysteinyl-tRNA synthetase